MLLACCGVLLHAQQTITWTGQVDVDWHKRCNWNPMVIPTCQDTVVIPTVVSGNYPVVSGIAHCKELNITTGVANALTIQSGARIDVSSAGGSCSGTPTDNTGVLSPAVNISGPTFVCLGDTGIWHAPHSAGNIWQWQYPPSWTVVAQSGDSIVLIPDSVDGYVRAEVCDNACRCGTDSVYIGTDSCYAFCEYINAGNDFGEGVMGERQGDIILVGGYLGGDQDIWLLRLAGNGSSIKLSRRYLGYRNDYGEAVCRAPDGGFIIGGYTDNYPYGDGVIIKVDSNLNTQWIKRVGWFVSNESEYVYDVQATSSGKIAYVGRRSGNSTGGVSQGIIGMLDTAGNLIWGKTVAGGSLIQLFGVQAWGNNIYAVGLVVGGPLGNQDGLLLVFDTLGNFKWGRALGSGGDDVCQSITTLPDSSVAIACTSYGINGGDAIVYRLSNNGSLIWARRVFVGGGLDFSHSITYTQDGGIVAVGGTESAGAGIRDVWVFKLDTNGNFLWGKAVGGAGNDQGEDVFAWPSNYVLVVGFTGSYTGLNDIYLIALDPDGNLPCSSGCNIVDAGNTGTWSAIASYTPSIANFGNSQDLTMSIGTGGTLVKICP